MWGRVLNPCTPFPAEAGSSAASPSPRAWPPRRESSNREGQMGRVAAASPHSHHLVAAVRERGEGTDISTVGKGEADGVAGPPTTLIDPITARPQRRQGIGRAPRLGCRRRSYLRARGPSTPFATAANPSSALPQWSSGTPPRPSSSRRRRGPLLFRSRSRGRRR
jgi:hypothetical protein